MGPELSGQHSRAEAAGVSDFLFERLIRLRCTVFVLSVPALDVNLISAQTSDAGPNGSSPWRLSAALRGRPLGITVERGRQ
jgi:hypothetical protein